MLVRLVYASRAKATLTPAQFDIVATLGNTSNSSTPSVKMKASSVIIA